MRKYITQLEILLIIDTTFSSRKYAGNENTESQQPVSEKEILEEACWNGMLQEMLPEICGRDASSQLFIWKIKDATSFLDVEIGEFPKEINKRFSIDPYSFIELQSVN